MHFSRIAGSLFHVIHQNGRKMAKAASDIDLSKKKHFLVKYYRRDCGVREAAITLSNGEIDQPQPFAFVDGALCVEFAEIVNHFRLP
jgi:hypothetical protein